MGIRTRGEGIKRGPSQGKAKMEVKKYKRIATDIADLFGDGYTHANGRLEPYEPAEFQMGLTLALAMYFVAMFPKELQSVLDMHQQSLLMTVEELVAKSHPDDRLDMSGFAL